MKNEELIAAAEVAGIYAAGSAGSPSPTVDALRAFANLVTGHEAVAKEKRPSDRLLALMGYAKGRNGDFTWKSVEKPLAELYHPKMNLSSAMHHLVAAYVEAADIKKLEMGVNDRMMLDLVLSPVVSHTSVELMGPKSLDTEYSVDAFYNSMASKIWGSLSITRIDWLTPEEKEKMERGKQKD